MLNTKKIEKTRVADQLLKGLQQAASMEKGELKGRDTVRTLSKPARKWSKKEIKGVPT